jgi:hypothetical protein
MMEVASTSETSINFYQTTRRYNPEDSHLHTPCCENLIPQFDEHKLYLLAFVESSVDRQWDRVIFCDESTFSSTNDGLVLVYRPWGERYNSQYVSNSTCSGHVCVHCWGWISHEGAGILHFVEEHPDGLQYKYILKHVIVPSVRVLYTNRVIHLKQDYFLSCSRMAIVMAG